MELELNSSNEIFSKSIIQKNFRQPKHLLDFLLAELGTSGSMDGNQQLIIKGRFQSKQIENVLRRYKWSFDINWSLTAFIENWSFLFLADISRNMSLVTPAALPKPFYKKIRVYFSCNVNHVVHDVRWLASSLVSRLWPANVPLFVRKRPRSDF